MLPMPISARREHWLQHHFQFFSEPGSTDEIHVEHGCIVDIAKEHTNPDKYNRIEKCVEVPGDVDEEIHDIKKG